MSEPLQIFLAEDNGGDIFLVQQALAYHKIPHTLLVASEGDEALRLLQEVTQPGNLRFPDLILLDLNLPKSDGHELLTSIRANPASQHTPVIVITSSDSPRDRKRAADLGANRYFKKPFDFDEFLKLGSLIKEVLSTSQIRSPPA